jgi:hypothetical protein
MNKLFRLLGSIPQDKLLHYIGGMLIYAISAKFMSWYIALIVVFLIAVGKEFYDTIKGGCREIMDIVAAMIGAVTILLINLI